MLLVSFIYRAFTMEVNALSQRIMQHWSWLCLYSIWLVSCGIGIACGNRLLNDVGVVQVWMVEWDLEYR